MSTKHGPRHRPGTAAYAKGQETAANVLTVAKDIVIEEGMAKLTMRGVARAMGMSPGNLSYYYATKADLLADLLASVLEPYLSEFERLRQLEADSPEAQLRAVLEFVYDDLAEKDTTHFFPELWAMALRDEDANRQMERMYETYRSVLREIIKEMRPDLGPTVVKDLALTIAATIEGHTVFIGHERPHKARASNVKTLILEQLITMVRTAPQGSDSRHLRNAT